MLLAAGLDQGRELLHLRVVGVKGEDALGLSNRLRPLLGLHLLVDDGDRLAHLSADDLRPVVVDLTTQCRRLLHVAKLALHVVGQH